MTNMEMGGKQTMKKFMKMICMASFFCLMMAALAACGKKDTVDETKGNVVIDENKTTTATKESATETESEEPTTKPPFEETKADVSVSVPAELDSMRPILMGICKTMAGGNTYDSSNSEFFWNSIYSAINGSSWIHPDISLSDDGSGYQVPREVMSEYAEAMFAGNSMLPDVPSSVGGIEFVVDTDCYNIYSSEGYTGSMDFTEIEETDNGYEVQVAFTTRSGSVETHTFILTSGGYGAFPCAVNSVE